MLSWTGGRVLATDSEPKCNFPWADIPLVSDEMKMETEEVGVKLGFSDEFGGVGVEFELTNKSGDGRPVNILEGRSGAGAGWQYTGMLYGYQKQDLLINQAGGNGLGYQWGYKSQLEAETVNGEESLNSTNWIRNYSDTINGAGVSPCRLTGQQATYVDEGRPRMVMRKGRVKGFEVVEIDSSYQLKSMVDQYWKTYVPTQAFYLNRKVAKEGDLRIYFVADDWIEGPIRPYDDFSVVHAKPVSPNGVNWTVWQVSTETKEALFVWKVEGKDIGVLIRGVNEGSSLRLEKKVYCQDEMNDDCGNINYIINSDVVADAVFLKGSTREYTFKYVVGTVPQLEEWAGRSLTPDSAFGKGCRIQGVKTGVSGVEVMVNGGELKSKEDPYVMEGVVSGKKTVEVVEPRGYGTEYSYCRGCTDHEESSWVAAKTVDVVCENGSYVDLWWRFSRTSSVGDADGNGKVNVADFAIWKTEYLTKNGTRSDFDKNGKVTIADFAIWKTEYLKTK